MEKVPVVLVFLTAFVFIGSSALNSSDVLHLLEKNSAFDTLHRNYDFRVNTALAEKSHYLNVLNAQLISRLGFAVDEIRVQERQVLDAILQRGANISAPNAECIVDARLSIENAADYAGYNMNGLIGEVMWYINDIEARFFFPLINILQTQSNLIQSTVFTELGNRNPVTNINQVIQRIEDDYYIDVILYQSAIANIQREMTLLDDQMNQMKSSYFPQLDAIRDYFTFTSNFITEYLTECNA